jgi:hypothetical protein
MNLDDLDDFDKIPCSEMEFLCSDFPNVRINDGKGNSAYFKLVPKKKEEPRMVYCEECGAIGPRDVCEKCLDKAVERSTPNPDRFAEVEGRIEDMVSRGVWSRLEASSLYEIARAIVKVIEGEKK